MQNSDLPLCGTKPPTKGAARRAYEEAVKINDGDTCMADPRGTTTATISGDTKLFFALNPASVGSSLLRYVDRAGWAIEYPRGFHGLAYSVTVAMESGTDGASFGNFAPLPGPDAPPSVPPDGVLLVITHTWAPIAPGLRLVHDSHFPLHLSSSFDQAAEFDFQGNGVAYHASVVAGPKASSADLEALRRMVASISFPPAGGARASGGRSPHAS